MTPERWELLSSLFDEARDLTPEARAKLLDERKAKVVELRFYGGLTTDEVAEVLGVSRATVEREWSFARAWLYDSIEGTETHRDER